MVLDAIDEYVDPLTKNFGIIMNISCSEQRYLEQLVTEKNCEFKLLPVHIEKLCHEDHPTTKEDFYIGLTK